MKKCNEMRVSDFDSLLERVSKCEYIDLESFDLLIFSCSMNKEEVVGLREMKGVEVLWSGWPWSRWTRFLSFIPSRLCLTRILDLSVFGSLFSELSSYGLCEALYVPQSYSHIIIDEVIEKLSSANFEKLTSNLDEFFMLSAETDEAITRKGVEYYFCDYTFGNGIDERIRQLFDSTLKL